MPSENNNLVSDLNQIRRRQEQIVVDIERLKEQYGGEELTDIEKIEADVYKTILDIDEIGRQRDAGFRQAGDGMNVLLFEPKTRRPAQQRTRCGNIVF